MNDEQPNGPQPSDIPAEADHAASPSVRRVIKIGSQRERGTEPEPAATQPAEESVADIETADDAAPEAPADETADDAAPEAPADETATEAVSFPPPRVTRVSADLQREIDEALGGLSVDQLLAGASGGVTKGPEPEIEQRYRATVVKVFREDVFCALPGNYEGAVPLKHFEVAPEPGMPLEVVVTRFNADEGLYELTIPGKSIEVADWSDLAEGVTVEARVTGHNSGGLECEVHTIRGFIPVSQIALYRVENLAEFVDQKFSCVVTEANPARGNLVLSRRAVLEREQAEEKERLLQTLEVGQVREGVVRNIRDFGAFVDIGGVDGLVHISKLSWDRVNHPSDVLEEGQRIKVQIEQIDETTGKIGLSYRDLLADPWEQVAQKYHENDIVTGTVSRIADFGAFVKLEAGVEGLVHISELAHHRVQRVDTIVSEGQAIQIKILSIDPDNQRMSLSLKAVQVPPAETTRAAADEADAEPPRPRATKPHRGTLKGGTNRPTGGEQFGLKW